ncbi:MAG: hypothetical protein SGJ20_06635 [Planctomycetota bacterium]|nr:hypothetical protein [Planctomycetota bacterium]
MADVNTPPTVTLAPPHRNSIGRFLLWFLPGILAALAIARVSVSIQDRFAPLIVLPICVGAAVACVSYGLMHLAGFRSFWPAVIGTMLLGLIAAAGEHAFFYFDFRAEYLRQIENKPQLAATGFCPPSIKEYFVRQSQVDSKTLWLWTSHAILLVAAAGAMTGWLVRRADRSTASSAQ